LAARCDGACVVTVDKDHCLLIYPLPDWEELERKLVRLPSMNKVARRIVRIMVGYATEVDMDGSGRILVSRELREFAGLAKEAMLIGQGNKFELWDEATWVAKRDEWLTDEEDGELPADLESLSF
jgi:MraZ protein